MEAIQLNTIAISDEEITTSDVELGSVLAEHRLLFYIDIYAESKAIGRHLSGDIKDILEGQNEQYWSRVTYRDCDGSFFGDPYRVASLPD